MTYKELRLGRQRSGLSQVQAASRLGVSQSYLAMLEAGTRRLTPDLARKVMRLYELSPSVLPPSRVVPQGQRLDQDALAAELAALGYPGFSHLRSPGRQPKNPVEVLLAALSQDDLDARLVEALPWVVLQYCDLDRAWLVREAKLGDLQNRLGFVVSLARRLAQRTGASQSVDALRDLEADLERSRLAREDTLCRRALPAAERRWLESHRSDEARHWNLLTDWTVDALRYAS